MKRIILWSIAALLLFTFFIIRYWFFESYAIADTSALPEFIIELIATCLLIVLISALIALLTALIPFRKKKYSQKFTFLFPLFVTLLMITNISLFGYLAYVNHSKGINLHLNMDYNSIEIPRDLDCSDVKDGSFQIDKLLIKRQGNRQIQTDTETGNSDEFEVVWLNNCEYSLILPNHEKEFLKVKIISVSADSYDCYVLSSQSRYVAKYRVNRIKD